MPYKSQVHVGFMHAKHPKIAAEWDKKYGVPKNLPKRKSPISKAAEENLRRGYRKA